MAREFELKFDLDPAGPDRFSGLAPIRELATGPPTRRHLITTYYDTPALTCLQNGVGFRIRRQNGTLIQSVKTDRPGERGVFVREEIEFPLNAATPDFERLDGTEFEKIFTNPAVRNAMKPVFVTDFFRTSWLLRLDDGTEIEAAVDIGTIEAGQASEPILELELELKAGPPQSLLAFAKKLATWMPLRPNDVSKAARGYRMAKLRG